MIRMIKRKIILLICILIITGSLSANDNSPLYFWNIKTDISNVYILGSIHILNEDFYPLPCKIEAAFEESDILVVEADINSVQDEEMVMLVLQKGIYTDGSTIRDLLGDEEFLLLRKKLEELELPVNAFLTFKPWLLAITIQAMNFDFYGYDSSHGLDLYFLNKAEHKEVLEFESVEYQLNMFTGMTEELQIAFLLSTLTDNSLSVLFLEQVIEFWKTGEADSMYMLIYPENEITPLDKELMQLFFFDRNILMADRIESFLDTGGNYFIIVGAGHMAGEGSIIDILNERGNKVIQMYE